MNAQYVGDVWNRMRQAPLGEAVGGLLSSSLICAVAALLIALAVASIVRVRGSAPITPYAAGERLALGGIALAVGAVWFVDVVLRGYVLDLSAAVSWWRFTVAPGVAAVGLLVWGLAMRARSPRRVVGAASVTRRTWTTFGPRRGIPLFAVVAVVTAAVTIVLGRMSTAFDPGLSAHVALEAPNTSAVLTVTPFPGWAYGIPLLVALLVLAAAAAFALHRNAVRPFTGGTSLDVERSHRAAVAGTVIGISTAAAMIALAGLLRMARAGVVTTMTELTPSGRDALVAVRVPHEDLILVGGSVAPLLEIAGCVVLVLAVVRAAAFARGAWHRADAAIQAQA